MSATYEIKPVTAEKIEAFVAAYQNKIVEDMKDTPACITRPTVKHQAGPKYIRVYKEESPDYRSVLCFVEKATGSILKADGWRTPAKGARGNVNTPTHGIEFVTPYGAQYLR